MRIHYKTDDLHILSLTANQIINISTNCGRFSTLISKLSYKGFPVVFSLLAEVQPAAQGYKKVSERVDEFLLVALIE